MVVWVMVLQGCVAFSKEEGLDGFAHSSVITASVKGRLVTTNGLDGMRILVSTVNGDVLLGGFVPTQEQKEIAGKVALNTQGVNKVINSIEVLQ